MKKVRTFQTNFASGQLDPLMAGRSDTKAYGNGAETLTNVMQLVQGGVKRRMGTQWLADHTNLPDDDARYEDIKIIPFVFDDDERYLFVLYKSDTGSAPQTKIDIYRVNMVDDLPNSLSEGKNSITLATTVTAPEYDDFNKIRYAQRNDVMILVHEDAIPYVITRTGLTSFTSDVLNFDKNGANEKVFEPFYAFQPSRVTITPSGSTNYESGDSVTLTTSADYFTQGINGADHIGSKIAIHGQQILITAVTSATVASGTIQEDLFKDQNITVTDTSEYIIGETVTQTDTEAVGIIVSISSSTVMQVSNLKSVQFIGQNTGEATVGAESGAAQKASSVALAASPLATEDWKENVFNTARGWPASVCFHGSRLWFGGSYSLPAHLFSSKVSEFFNFDVGEALDDESIQVPIASDKVNKIRHLVSAAHLQVFTDEAEFYCPESENTPLTPTDFNIRKQSSYGTNYVRPLPFDRATLFVQNAGTVIREYKWEEIEGGYTPNAISLASTSVLDTNGIIDSSVIYGLTKRPEQYAFFLNYDGSLAVYHAARNEQISSWSNWETVNGSYKSICAIDSFLFAIGDRTIDGTRTYTIEVFSESVTLDCCKQIIPTTASGYTAENQRTFADFANVEVSVVCSHGGVEDADYFANAFYIGDLTADASGVITLPNDLEFYTWNVGYNFTSEIKTMSIDYVAADGPIITSPKKVNKIDALFNNTLAANVDNKDVIIQTVNQDFSQAPVLFTGRKRFYKLGWNSDVKVEVKSVVPLDFTLLALMIEVAY